MAAQGGQGPWQPRGSGLLVTVVVLSVVALVAHGAVALVLLNGTVHRVARAAAGPAADPTATPSRSAGSASNSASPHLDHACLTPDNPPTSAVFPPNDPFGTDMTELGDKAELQRLYAVHDRDLVPIDGAGPVRPCDAQLWGVVVTALPTHLRGFLREFLVFDADVGPNASDGAVGDTVPAGKDSGQWRMSLAPNGQSDVEVALTIAHEIGHLATLNVDELASPQPSTCQTMDVGQGCLNDSSYLVEFIDGTWSDAELDDWNAAITKPDKATQDPALREFYEKHRASFVDAYAATDPVEDFAETFALWCAIDPGNPVRSQFIDGDPTDGANKLQWFDTGSSSFRRSVNAPCVQLRELTR